MPIHNEEVFLPYSLPSVFKLQPDEVVLMLDRCTDRSLNLTKKLVNRYGYNDKTKIVEVHNKQWNFQIAYLFRTGYMLAENDSILNAGADMILDSNIRRHIPTLGQDNIALISFEVLDFPINYRNLLKRFFEYIRLPFAWLSGAFLFSKKAWLETENQETVKNIECGEDTLLSQSIRTKYKSKIVLTKTMHLRPRETSEYHYLRGRTYWNVAHRSLPLTMLSGLSLFRLSLIKGYLHERFRGGQSEEENNS